MIASGTLRLMIMLRGRPCVSAAPRFKCRDERTSPVRTSLSMRPCSRVRGKPSRIQLWVSAVTSEFRADSPRPCGGPVPSGRARPSARRAQGLRVSMPAPLPCVPSSTQRNPSLTALSDDRLDSASKRRLRADLVAKHVAGGNKVEIILLHKSGASVRPSARQSVCVSTASHLELRVPLPAACVSLDHVRKKEETHHQAWRP